MIGVVGGDGEVSRLRPDSRWFKDQGDIRRGAGDQYLAGDIAGRDREKGVINGEVTDGQIGGAGIADGNVTGRARGVNQDGDEVYGQRGNGDIGQVTGRPGPRRSHGRII